MKVGEVVEKISELKSRKAIASQLVMYLQAHYLSSDTGAPEMRITRDDCHMVPEDHIKVFINEISDGVDESEAMQVEFENFMAQDPQEAQEKKLADEIRKKTAKTRKANNGNRNSPRKRRNQTAAADPESDPSG